MTGTAALQIDTRSFARQTDPSPLESHCYGRRWQRTLPKRRAVSTGPPGAEGRVSHGDFALPECPVRKPCGVWIVFFSVASGVEWSRSAGVFPSKYSSNRTHVGGMSEDYRVKRLWVLLQPVHRTWKFSEHLINYLFTLSTYYAITMAEIKHQPRYWPLKCGKINAWKCSPFVCNANVVEIAP